MMHTEGCRPAEPDLYNRRLAPTWNAIECPPSLPGGQGNDYEVTMNTLITVVSVVGQVWAVAANGARRLVQKGEQLLVSETLVLAPGAQETF